MADKQKTRLLARIFCLGLLMAVVAMKTSKADSPAVSEQDEAQRAVQLVKELGNRSFIKRKQATQELAKMGLPALRALEVGAQGPNREIRYRCERILSVVRELDLQRRLQAFLKDTDSDKYRLPGWLAFKALAGESANSKQIFVAMQKADSELMLAVAGKGVRLTELAEERLVRVGGPSGGGEAELGIGATGAILFLLGDRRVAVTPRLTAFVYKLAFDQRARELLSGDDGSAGTLRVLLARVLKRQATTDPYRPLLVAMQYQLEESLDIAVRLLNGGNPSSRARQLALVSVNRYGNQSHVVLVERFLGDNAPVPVTVRGAKKGAKVEVRDVALATLITLEKQDHRKFGFANFRLDRLGFFDRASLQFDSDVDRQAALDLWKAFREQK